MYFVASWPADATVQRLRHSWTGNTVFRDDRSTIGQRCSVALREGKMGGGGWCWGEL